MPIIKKIIISLYGELHLYVKNPMDNSLNICWSNIFFLYFYILFTHGALAL